MDKGCYISTKSVLQYGFPYTTIKHTVLDRDTTINATHGDTGPLPTVTKLSIMLLWRLTTNK